jgi:hypothetical protein
MKKVKGGNMPATARAPGSSSGLAAPFLPGGAVVSAAISGLSPLKDSAGPAGAGSSGG